MGKLQYIQCLGCGTPTPVILNTNGTYEGTCPHCQLSQTILHNVVRPIKVDGSR